MSTHDRHTPVSEVGGPPPVEHEPGVEIHQVPSQRSPEYPAFFTVPETAHFLRLDESTLYRRIRRGGFPAIKIGARYLVPAGVIDRLVADVVGTGRRLDIDDWTDQWNATTSTGSGERGVRP